MDLKEEGIHAGCDGRTTKAVHCKGRAWMQWKLSVLQHWVTTAGKKRAVGVYSCVQGCVGSYIGIKMKNVPGNKEPKISFILRCPVKSSFVDKVYPYFVERYSPY